LSEETHASLHELFGTVNLTAMRQLALLSRRGHLVDAAGENRYLTHLDRLAIPIAYIHGEDNDCVLPVSTERTRALLSATNGDHLYRRHVIPAYGHVDCMIGRDAAKYVFPLIAGHLSDA